MKVSLKFNKKNNYFLIYIDGFLFTQCLLKKNKKSLDNLSLGNYNYMVLVRKLRQYGLMKTLLNKNDYIN